MDREITRVRVGVEEEVFWAEEATGEEMRRKQDFLAAGGFLVIGRLGFVWWD